MNRWQGNEDLFRRLFVRLANSQKVAWASCPCPFPQRPCPATRESASQPATGGDVDVTTAKNAHCPPHNPHRRPKRWSGGFSCFQFAHEVAPASTEFHGSITSRFDHRKRDKGIRFSCPHSPAVPSPRDTDRVSIAKRTPAPVCATQDHLFASPPRSSSTKDGQRNGDNGIRFSCPHSPAVPSRPRLLLQTRPTIKSMARMTPSVSATRAFSGLTSVAIHSLRRQVRFSIMFRSVGGDQRDQPRSVIHRERDDSSGWQPSMKGWRSTRKSPSVPT